MINTKDIVKCSCGFNGNARDMEKLELEGSTNQSITIHAALYSNEKPYMEDDKEIEGLKTRDKLGDGDIYVCPKCGTLKFIHFMRE